MNQESITHNAVACFLHYYFKIVAAILQSSQLVSLESGGFTEIKYCMQPGPHIFETYPKQI